MTYVFDPPHVLGCSRAEAAALLRGKRVTPGEVESVAMRHYSWRSHLRDPDSYWVTVSQAAVMLHLSPQQVKRLLDEGHLPHVVHVSGVRLMRRSQIESLVGRAPTARHRRREHARI
ncbi:MAG TPA: helix-turn-helix domain-containing protein [Nocardioidaceae bacterium]|nr:helix-turn-helix domain-containing protein [Nocardioidaceae bacterium]